MERGLSPLAAVLVFGGFFIDIGSAESWRSQYDWQRNQVCAPDPESASIGDRATCTFTRSVDVDENRIPARIPVVSCKCLGRFCKDGGDFRCHEVRETFHVMFFNRREGHARNKTLEVVTSCVCAVGRSAQASSSGAVKRTELNATDWRSNRYELILGR